jgi:hypothetical protein
MTNGNYTSYKRRQGGLIFISFNDVISTVEFSTFTLFSDEFSSTFIILEMIWKQVTIAYMMAISNNLFKGTEENYEEHQSG